MSRVLTSLKDPSLSSLLQGGAVGVLPTDTVYGLVCSTRSQTAVNKLYALKSREQKPGTLIAASIEQLVSIGFKRRYLAAYEHLWPNPLSIEVPHHITYLNQGTGRQAVRVVGGPLDLLDLLNVVGPLLTSSANLPGEKPAQTISEAQAYFGEKIDFYVDGGDLGEQKPSTLIRVIDDAIEVIRPGAVDIDENGRIS